MTKYSVKKPFTVLVGIILVLVLGVVSFFELNTDLLPAMDLPYVVVFTTYPGASPERVEVAVTQPLEQAVATTSGLENIQSISAENLSLIIMEFSGSTNMDSAMIELSNNIDMVSGYMDDMVGSPTLMKINPDMLPVQMISVDVDDMDIKQLTAYVNDELAPRLERIDGVATVDVSGGVKDHVKIRLNQKKIDRINDSIIKAVDSDLYEAKKELLDAQAELEDGIDDLEDREKEAYNRLGKVSAELDTAQAQMAAITAQESTLKGQIEAFEKAKGAISGFAVIDKAIDELLADTTNIVTSGLPRDYTLGQLKAVTTDDEDLKAKINIVTMGVEGIKTSADPAITDDTKLVEIKDELKGTAKATAAMFGMGGISADFFDRDDPLSTALLDGKIKTLKQDYELAKTTAKAMEKAVAELKTQYARVEAQKMRATAELGSRKSQLSSAEKQIESGIEQFEDARDTALKNANIDSLVTNAMLKNILTAQNFSMPAGYITDSENEMTVKVGETFASLEELENLLLVDMGLDGVKPIYLKDVADISVEDNSGNSYVRINGNPGITLSIQKSSTASTSRVSDLVNKEMEKVMTEDTAVHLTQLMDQGVYIDMVVSSVIDNMVYGGIIALFVLIFFLQDFKPTLIIGLSIPLSVLFAIVMMYFSDVNLNVMSLSGLALGIGMLVDNSIVVIENVYRLRTLGYSKVKAAVIGAQQVAGAIASSTLTTICVFLPIVFTDGLARQLFVDMGLTIGYSLIASLVVALTVVPAMASFILNKTKDTSEGILGKGIKVYEKMLRWSLDRKWLVIVLCVGLLVGSGYAATKMPMTLIPAMDSTQMQLTLSMPIETPDEELIANAEIIAERVSAIEDIQTVGITKGSSGMAAMMGSSETNDASFYIVLKEDKKLTNEEIGDIILEKNPEFRENLTVTANTMDMGALMGSGLTVQIKGNDLDTLQTEAVRMGQLLKSVEGVGEVDDGSGEAIEELRIEINKKAAMEKGMTVAQVYSKVSEALTEETTATTLTFEGEELDAIIHAATTYTRDNIANLVVTTETDDDGNEKNIRLKQIATIGTATTPESIGRTNQSRYVTVSAKMKDGYNATLVGREVEKLLADYEMPTGFSFEMTGEDESVNEAMFEMVKMIGLAIVFIYLIMVAQFQSLKSPFIVMFTIPLAFTGGLLALLLTGSELSIVAMIGFLVLAGVVVNNGIVFVDYVNQLRLGGMEKRAALVQTGTDRIRPILMTAMTTILANSTLAMGVGMGAELSQGMAMVSIGGLAYATLLTLFLVPALYDIFNKGEYTEINVDFEEEGI